MRSNSEDSITKVRAFVLNEQGAPRSGVAVALRNKGAVVAILQSDHAGFVSFLAPGKLDAPGDLTIDVLNAQLPATAAGIDAPALLTVPDGVALPAAPRWMPSVASGDAGDRQLSPTSFGSVTSAAVGDGACQTLLPGVLPEHSYEIRQLVPFLRDTGKIKKAYLIIYNVTWFPVGHALGDLIYTLPLAPGESTNVAIVDWARQDTAGRVESAQIDENLVHELGRDRTIDDTMNATLNERQSGWSFMTALAGQYNGGQYSIAGSTGGAYSESDGFRDLTSNAMQTVADRIAKQQRPTAYDDQRGGASEPGRAKHPEHAHDHQSQSLSYPDHSLLRCAPTVPRRHLDGRSYPGVADRISTASDGGPQQRAVAWAALSS